MVDQERRRVREATAETYPALGARVGMTAHRERPDRPKDSKKGP